MPWIILCAFLSGCSLARLNEPANPNFARINIAKLDSGEVAVYVFAVESSHRILTQAFTQEMSVSLTSFSLSKGSYSLEIECRRPGSGIVLHGGINFEIAVQTGGEYILDCSPTKSLKYGYAENNFSFSKLPN